MLLCYQMINRCTKIRGKTVGVHVTSQKLKDDVTFIERQANAVDF